jgi:hypothetical protein
MKDNNKLIVKYYTQDLIPSLLIIGFFTAVGILGLIFSNMKALSIMFIVLLAITALALIVPTVFFRLEVTDNKMYSRSRLGKEFEFTLSDIKSIQYQQYNRAKYGPRFFLELHVGDKTVSLHKTMSGFKEFIEYLEDKHNSGELSTSVLSKKTLKTLKEIEI